MEQTLIGTEGYRDALAIRDLTDSAHGAHALQLLVHSAIDRLRAAWDCPVIVHRAHPAVPVAENYELLDIPADAAARDARYTRYVSADTVLRTSTSAMIPSLLPSIAAADYADVLLACVGLVYRRDRIDRQSVGEPHQLDLWRIRRRPVGDAELQEMVAAIVEALLPDCEYRTNATRHPYTLNGLEIEARSGQSWVEIAECGLASPRVLGRGGLPVDRCSGLAMGIGLDRVLMLRKGIDDIRLLRSADERVASQMLDLSRYRAVSAMPPIRRDLSIAVAAGTSAEQLGDRVRLALGERAGAVEVVEVLSETPAEELPSQAAARLGISPDQRNLLVKVILRHPTRTLTGDEANRLRDQVYEAIHEGTAWQWAGR